jgi:hypothetical protein
MQRKQVQNRGGHRHGIYLALVTGALIGAAKSQA